ncbi:MAG: phage baseplate assembly protein V [Vicinamibacterales bacterium]
MKSATRARALDQRYFGVVEALVSENAGDDAKEGRVKVKFPWFDGDMVTEWCRVAQIYAGNGYGGFWVPEVGDEVLVGFIHGDMRFPVILGGLYNGQDKPSTSREQDKDQKLFRTKGGHELLFDDTSGQQKVKTTTNAGHVLDMDDDNKKVTLATTGGHQAVLDDQQKTVTIQTSGSNEIVLDDNSKTITIQTAGGAVITLDGSGNKITVQATTVDVQATTVNVQGTTVNVEATTIKLGGSAASQGLVLGDAFMAYFNTHTHNATSMGAPTSPPIVSMQTALISQVSKTT